MTKISQYSTDVNITGNDKWIGSDAQNFLITKNFTPNNLASFFNENNVIDIGASIRYMYQTLLPGEAREQGTISFETEIGPQVNFSDITTFLIAKNTLKGNTVTQYLDFLVDGKVLLSKASNINIFGYYKITSIEPWIPNTNFFVVEVDFLAGNGFIYEDLDYLVSLVDKVQEVPPPVWGSITGDIEDQTDLINYISSQIPPSLIGEITIDSYIGSRLQPTNTSSNGFWANRNVNGSVGYGARNQNTGNGAVAGYSAGIDSNNYLKTISVIKFGPNYYVPLLAGKGGLVGTEEVFVGSYDGNDVSILTGSTFASITRKFTVKADGQLLIQTTPTTGTTSDKLLVRDTSGNVKQIDYPTIPTAVTSVTATSPITSSGGTTPDISTSMSTNKLIGRSTAGTGVMEEITVGTGLSLSGGTLNATAQTVGFEQNFLLMGS
jgi:hypothetical protein